ncbi:39S ribosomal protein L9, partial [Fasciolopsis buskii]
ENTYLDVCPSVIDINSVNVSVIALKSTVSCRIPVICLFGTPVGLGVMGSIVSVHRNRFWRYLYLCQLAELPTPERVEHFRALGKNQSRVLSGEGYESEQRLSNMTLYIPMNPASDWTLTVRNVKVAFRKYAFWQVIFRSLATKRRVSRMEVFRLERSVHQPSTVELVPLSSTNEAALKHFDKYYTQVYGADQWSAMRVALLCPPTKVALLNRFSSAFVDRPDFPARFRGLIDLTAELQEHLAVAATSVDLTNEVRQPHKEALSAEAGSYVDPVRPQLLGRCSHGTSLDPSNLSEFVPVTELISESEVYTRSVDEEFMFVPDLNVVDGHCPIVSETFRFPEQLRVLCLDKNRTHYLGSPRFMDGQYDFYPIDLASIVPVLALNLKSGDTLLDMCAAPGGKSVTALQTMLLSRLLCVDNVQSRLERLQRSLACYGPVSSPELAIDVIHETQLSDYVRNQLVCGPNDSVQLFDKVLVDVPCSTDRHALCSHQGSLFSPGRAAARIGLPSTQSRLLRRAINLCRPGGSLVYCTCTLSPAQNQIVVQSCLQQINQADSSMRCELVDLSPLIRLFQRTESKLGLRTVPVFFSDHVDSPPIGLLVIPSVSANYGPAFVAKMRRIS